MWSKFFKNMGEKAQFYRGVFRNSLLVYLSRILTTNSRTHFLNFLLFTLGNAIFATFAENVPMIPVKNICRDISQEFCINFLKLFLQSSMYIFNRTIETFDQKKKINVIFLFTLLCGTWKMYYYKDTFWDTTKNWENKKLH